MRRDGELAEVSTDPPGPPGESSTSVRRPSRGRPATVILLRGGADTLEVLLVRRNPSARDSWAELGCSRAARSTATRATARTPCARPRCASWRRRRGQRSMARAPRPVLALDHAGRGQDPLRHLVLPGGGAPAACQAAASTAARWSTPAGIEPGAALEACRLGRAVPGLPDDQAPRAAVGVPVGRAS